MTFKVKSDDLTEKASIGLQINDTPILPLNEELISSTNKTLLKSFTKGTYTVLFTLNNLETIRSILSDKVFVRKITLLAAESKNISIEVENIEVID